MKTNTLAARKVASRSHTTHEGAPARRITPLQELTRSVCACLLWEDSFYESGEDIAKRIAALIAKVPAAEVAALAIRVRSEFNLRHVPLLIVREMARLKTHRSLVATTLAAVIQRADELSEFVSIYWKDGKQPLSAQVKKGLAAAFLKFNAYGFAKYNREAAVTLRDVLFLCHAKPKDENQAVLFKQIIDDTLPTPDTWEVELSSGADKKAAWTRLIVENKLGALAFLRNLRNMEQAGVPRDLVRTGLLGGKTDRVLPYRFISAAKYAPYMEPALETLMLRSLGEAPKLPGHTTLLIDVSGSMEGAISSKSDINRIDAAAGLAILLREICADVNVFIFANQIAEVPARRGFALRDAIVKSVGGGTYLGGALQYLKTHGHVKDRLIVLTDEQSADTVGGPGDARGYMVNVAANKNGVGYGKWNNITGWSESVVRYIQEMERAGLVGVND